MLLAAHLAFLLLMLTIALILLMLVPVIRSSAQKPATYQLRTVAFYNLENLFDTEDDSLTYDDSRTPGGRDLWTRSRYLDKIEKVGEVLATIGTELSGNSPDLIGLCEVENRQVLEDLVNCPGLKKANFGILHFDSPDERGIDVALIYKRSAFSPIDFHSQRLLVHNAEGERDYTRDVLVVSGLLDGDLLYLLVNHWPSRSGGQLRSAPYRKAAALLNLQITDSLTRTDPLAKIMLMGDLNDNPTDDSLKKALKAIGDTTGIEGTYLYNPMEVLYKKGAGSLAYRDRWNLFDQILVSSTLLSSRKHGYRFWKAGIHNPPSLSVRQGKYRGYPKRTYAGGRYSGGYSDHFPVYAYLIRPVK